MRTIRIDPNYGGDRLSATVTHLKKISQSYRPNATGGTGDSTNATFGFTLNDEIQTYHYPCHRHLNKVPTEGVHTVFSLYCKPQQKLLSSEMNRRYFDWLVDSDISPWRSLFSVEPHSEFSNEEFWWSNGFIFSNFLKMPANLIMNFFVATRMSKEWPEEIKRWDDLVQKYNVDPALAYTALKLFHGGETLTLNTADFYDWPLNNATCSEEYVRNFCFGNPVAAKGVLGKQNDPHAEEPYGKINTVWGPSDCSSSSGKKPSYQRILFDIYGDKLGQTSARKSTFGGSSASSILDWTLTFSQMIDLLHAEEDRLLNASSSKSKAA